MSKVVISAAQHVTDHWGKDAPAWINDLAKECDNSNQVTVARKLGRSASLINQLLKRKYPGDLNDIQKRFESAFQPDLRSCPILGQITGEACLVNQGKKYDSSNHVAVSLFKACARCEYKLKGRKDA